MHAERLRFEEVKELATQISMPPHSWTPKVLPADNGNGKTRGESVVVFQPTV